MLDLRVVVYAVAFVCCHVAFHITRVLRLHVCFAFVRSVCLLAIVCLFFFCVIVYAFGLVCCNVVFQITRVLRLRVCFAFVFLFVCLSVHVV